MAWQVPKCANRFRSDRGFLNINLRQTQGGTAHWRSVPALVEQIHIRPSKFAPCVQDSPQGLGRIPE